MSEPTVETRLEKVEDQLSDWNTTCRIRVEGFPTLSERVKEVLRGGRELWNFKAHLARILWTDVSPVLKKVVTEQQLEIMGAEFAQAFGSKGDLQGVFGVGSNIDNAKIYDVRFKPSLSALRAHALVRKHVGPALKSANEGVSMWMPLSSGEARRKRKRQASSTTAPKSAANAPKDDRRSRPRRDGRGR